MVQAELAQLHRGVVVTPVNQHSINQLINKGDKYVCNSKISPW